MIPCLQYEIQWSFQCMQEVVKGTDNLHSLVSVSTFVPSETSIFSTVKGVYW